MHARQNLRLKLLQLKAKRTGNSQELQRVMEREHHRAKNVEEAKMTHTMSQFMSILQDTPPRQRAARINEFMQNLEPEMLDKIQEAATQFMGVEQGLQLEKKLDQLRQTSKK